MDEQSLQALVKPYVISHSLIEQELINNVSEISAFSWKIEEIRNNYEVDRKRTKERFNVFSCLTRHHLEELHSNFLWYLLNPHESHDCGELFLREFYAYIRNGDQSVPVSDISLWKFEKANVEREHFCGSIDGVRTFIDIYIECPDIIIAIENKINAGEQPDQIYRYSLYCKAKKKPFIILYLTKAGDKSATAYNEPYQPLSYLGIKDWLVNCINLTRDFPPVHFGIKFYVDLLNEKILYQPPNTIVMKVKNLLLEPENIHLLKYAKELTAALSEVRNQKRVDFFVSLAKELDAMNLQFRPVSRILAPIAVKNIWDNKSQGFTCFDPGTYVDTADGIRVYFCIEHNHVNLWYGLFTVKRDTNAGTNSNAVKDISRIKEIMAIKLPDMILSDEWWSCTRYFDYDDLSFGDDDLNYHLATCMEAVVGDFVTGVNNYLSVWKNTIDEYRQELA